MDIHRPQLFQRDPGLTGPAIPAILVKARADEEKWVWISNPLTSVGPVAVSYTHLDVYKRQHQQGPGCAGGGEVAL